MKRHCRSSRRRSTRRASHKRRSHRRRQHGGAACSALPQMNQVFAQRGGMAPIAQGDAYLLDTATRVQAEVAPLDKSFAELPSVIPKQGGGYRRRHRKSHKAKSHRKSRRHGRRRTYRRQQGGMMDFDAAYRYAPQGGYAGENPQIHTEQTVNPMFKIAGAQA